MKGFILLINMIITVHAVPKSYTDKKALLEDQKLQCDSLCTTYDGVFDFNDKLKTCICYVGTSFDDLELPLMVKNAKSMGMNLKTIKTTPQIISKRETSDQDIPPNIVTIPETEPRKKPISLINKGLIHNNPKEKQPSLNANKQKHPFSQNKLGQQKKEKPSAILKHPNNEEGAIVGARANAGGVNIKPRANNRPLQPQASPLQPGAMKDVWLKSRQRLDHLIKHSDGGKFNSRFAQSETQSIRNALKPLTLKSKPGQTGSKHPPKPFSGSTRNSGLMAGGLNKHPQGLKLNLKPAGNPLKPAIANQKPLLFNNKPNLSPLSGGPVKNKNSRNNNNPLTNPLRPKGQIASRNGVVGASKPDEAADDGGSAVPVAISVSTTTTTTQRGVSSNEVEVHKKDKTDKVVVTGGNKDKTIRTKGGKLDDVESKPITIAVQPNNNNGFAEDDEDFMED